jgi:hypothetical protein
MDLIMDDISDCPSDSLPYILKTWAEHCQDGGHCTTCAKSIPTKRSQTMKKRRRKKKKVKKKLVRTNSRSR